MEVKNSVLTENRKLVTIIKRKEDIERQRKQILKTEFKEINRIEKVIDRLEWSYSLCQYNYYLMLYLITNQP